MPAAQDAAWAIAIASPSTRFVEVGRYGAGAAPVLDGLGTQTDAFYLARNGNGGWRVHDLTIRNYTASGVYFGDMRASVTLMPFATDDYRGTAEGIWLHDLVTEDITVGTPNADPSVFLPGHNIFVGTGIQIVGANHVRVERVTAPRTDMPFFIQTSKDCRIDQFVSTHSYWQHSDWPVIQRGSLTNSVFNDQCELGYTYGAAAILVGVVRDILIQGTTFNGVLRPDPNGMGGPKTPDGYAIDFDFGGTRIVVDQCEIRDNAGGAVEYLDFTAPTYTSVPPTWPRHIWSRNTLINNGIDNSDRFNNAVGFAKVAPTQGMGFWWSNNVTITSPGTNVWFQQAQTLGAIPGTGAGAPWIARDNVGIPNAPNLVANDNGRALLALHEYATVPQRRRRKRGALPLAA